MKVHPIGTRMSHPACSNGVLEVDRSAGGGARPTTTSRRSGVTKIGALLVMAGCERDGDIISVINFDTEVGERIVTSGMIRDEGTALCTATMYSHRQKWHI